MFAPATDLTELKAASVAFTNRAVAFQPVFAFNSFNIDREVESGWKMHQQVSDGYRGVSTFKRLQRLKTSWYWYKHHSHHSVYHEREQTRRLEARNVMKRSCLASSREKAGKRTEILKGSKRHLPCLLIPCVLHLVNHILKASPGLKENSLKQEA